MPSPIKPSDLDAAVPSVFSNICSSFKSLFLLGPLLKTFWHWWMTTAGEPSDELKAWLAPVGVPTGALIDWTVDTSIPQGYLVANGQVVSRVTYAALFAVLKEKYGAGDGLTTFGLPTATGRFRYGASATVGVGSTGGNETVALTEDNNGPHTHRSVAAAQGENAYNTLWGSSPDGTATGKVYPNDHGLFTGTGTAEQPIATTLEASSSGAGEAFSILPPFIATVVLIKT